MPQHDVPRSGKKSAPTFVGPRRSLELSGTERRDIGLGNSKDELIWRRQRWAEVANEALASAGFSVRIDHRALRTIAPDREPELNLPLHIRKIELACVVTRQKEEARTAVMRRRALEAGLTKEVPRSVFSKEELLQGCYAVGRIDSLHMTRRKPREHLDD
jgi:hypothetical protein